MLNAAALVEEADETSSTVDDSEAVGIDKLETDVGGVEKLLGVGMLEAGAVLLINERLNVVPRP
jgi:hypothetical protein